MPFINETDLDAPDNQNGPGQFVNLGVIAVCLSETITLNWTLAEVTVLNWTLTEAISMCSEHLTQGGSVNHTITVEDKTSTLADGTVVLTVTLPDGTTVTPTVTRISAGVYSANIALPQSGLYRYWWQVTGTALGGLKGTFTVR